MAAVCKELFVVAKPHACLGTLASFPPLRLPCAEWACEMSSCCCLVHPYIMHCTHLVASPTTTCWRVCTRLQQASGLNMVINSTQLVTQATTGFSLGGNNGTSTCVFS